MNFKRNESETKLRGGYYTKPGIASFLIRWVQEIQPSSLLEPSCGDGVFFRCLADSDGHMPELVVGFELNPEEAEKARHSGSGLESSTLTVRAEDFLGWTVRHLTSDRRFDAVVGNPPFIRYQYCEPELQQESEAIFRHFDLKFTKHTNAWVPFVIASIAFLRPGGRLAMVIPAEILHVLHAQSLRTYLGEECSRLLIFDPEELWFDDALQGAVILLAEKKSRASERSEGVAIIPTKKDTFLKEEPADFFINASYANGSTIEGKWMLALLTETERGILERAEESGIARRFIEVAEADVGIVTGANKFFLVSDDVVEKYDLGPWAHPMFGRSDHVSGVIYDEEAHRRNKEAGRRANFLWFTDEEVGDLPPKVQQYIQEGVNQDLHTRYKCRIRDPWYSVPSVYASKVGMLKRSHHFPRMILNEAGVYTTDTAYRIKPKQVAAEDLVFSFVNSLTALSAELEGRHYGGGVLELVPSEIESLLLPLTKASNGELERLDRLVVEDTDPHDLLEAQDEAVFRKAGLTQREWQDLHQAWDRLRARRQRGD